MDQTEMIFFIVLASFVIAFFLVSIFLFAFQYKRKKYAHEKEKEAIAISHQKEILSAQLESQQETMQYIGREIHDNVGQKLTLASLYTKQLSAGSVTDIEVKVNAISSIIDESLADLRKLSRTLTNPELANANLLFLLNEEAGRINVSGICHVAIRDNTNGAILPPAEKNILFRLLQEFIQNSLKHAGCRKITIELEQSEEQLLVRAADDGKGFDTRHSSNGIGLQNMKRRAEQLGAGYRLESVPGSGTTLILQLPLIRHEANKI
jgi:signal transduction histidine kinase